MQICSVSTTQSSTQQAIQDVLAQLQHAFVNSPDLFIVSVTETYDIAEILKVLADEYPDSLIQGGSSCQGVMTESGFHSVDMHGLALLAIQDSGGEYGVGAANLGTQPRLAAQQAVMAAMEAADRPGEIPKLVWLVGAPGFEEALLQGISDVLGPNVPVAGGSSGDNAIAGNWCQFTGQGVYSDAVTVTLMYSGSDVSYAFHSGYSPSEVTGRVTECEGRTILKIDDRPAADVYNEWADHCIDDALKTGDTNILGNTTLHPLGRKVGAVNDVPYFRLSHPDAVTENHGLSLFSNVNQGDELTLMKGSVESLVTRAGRVADSAKKVSNWDASEIAGALVIYCAGCMLTVQQQMPEVVESLKASLPGIPFIGTFTFGEQGCFREGENYHGNLMISVVLLHK